MQNLKTIIIIYLFFLILFTNCKEKNPKLLQKNIDIEENLLPLPPKIINGNDINYFMMQNDSLLINKVKLFDLNSNIKLIDNKFTPHKAVDYFYFSHYKHIGIFKYFKHLTYEIIDNNLRKNYKLIEFVHDKYHHKIIFSETHYFYVIWNNNNSIRDSYDFNNLFINENTDTLITNLSLKRAQSFFPNFKGICLQKQLDSLIIDYKQYQVEDENFYISIYKQLNKNIK